MATNTYDIGDLVRVKVTFSANGTPTDPTTIKVKVKPPATAAVTYTYGTDLGVIRDSAGVYHMDVNIDKSGEWVYRWEGTGALQAAGEWKFTVLKSAIVSG